MKTFLNEVKLTWKWVVGKFKKTPPRAKESLDKEDANIQPRDISVVTLAIVLDGEVQEVIRAQDRMAALFLSGPDFVEIPDDLTIKPTIGWKYEDGKFVNQFKLPDPSSIIVSNPE